MAIRPVRVELAEIRATQDVQRQWVEQKHTRWWTSYSGDIYPHLERTDHGLLILDGHHRIQRDRDLGRRWTWARVHQDQAHRGPDTTR
jgi:hypothetical protein